MFEIDKNTLKLYRDYQYERASVYFKKEVLKLERPWTSHEILSKYKFTNIRRELDRESKYLIESVLSRDDVSLSDKLLNAAVFRCINCKDGIDSLAQWPIKFDELDIGKLFTDEVHYWTTVQGKRMQSNAYFLSHIRKVSNTHFPEYTGHNTGIVAYVNKFKDIILESYNKDTSKECCDHLSKLSSIGGPFMRYQIWVDWTYIPGSKFHESEYVISGPGCNLGITWMLFGDSMLITNAKNKPDVRYRSIIDKYPDKTYDDFLWWFTDNLPELMSSNELEWNPKEFQHFMPETKRDWNLMNVENLCAN